MTASKDNWSIIAALKPRLREHIRIHPQTYRGVRWYVLRDSASGRYMRFNTVAYAFIGRLDGELSIAEIHAALERNETESDRLTRDEIVSLLAQLSAVGALGKNLPVDARELFQRLQRERRTRLRRSFMNPLALRFPLLDPDRLLDRMLPWVQPLFSPGGMLLWLLVVCFAALLALANFQSIAAAAQQDILRPANLAAMALIFVLIKIAHEFAHAFAVKVWGGEVHEMGITLLVLAPVPYVDASAAWAFRAKRKRIMVSAVGILTELFIAALALFVWLSVEAGWLRDLAFNAMLIASVSTLLFNANPLLKFDGYHVLQDLIEIPNLYARASRYYLYLAQRYLLGVTAAESPVQAPGERGWFMLYGLCASLYRVAILVVIVLFLADEYLFVGVALGCWAVAVQLLLPLLRALRFLSTAPVLAGRRSRGIGTLALAAGALGALLFYLPVSLTTSAEGIVWMRDQANIYAGADGFVDELLVAPGSWVEAGTAIAKMRAPSLQGRIQVLRAQRNEFEIRRAVQSINDRVAAQITEDELARIDAELQYLLRQSEALTVRSSVAGRLAVPDRERLQGRYLRKGTLIGHLINAEDLVVRAVVPQADIGLLRKRIERVEIRLAERLHESLSSSVLRETPAGNTQLPSRALGAAGGGDIAVRSSDREGTTAAEAVFHVDLELPHEEASPGVGQRAYIRFQHGSEPLATQWWRGGRRLLLRRLSL